MHCPNCEMYLHPDLADKHVCPEPLPEDIALAYLLFHLSTGFPMHPRKKAQLVVSLHGSA